MSIVLTCACGKPCRVASIRIDPDEGEIWIEVRNEDPKRPTTDYLMRADRKTFKLLEKAVHQGAKPRKKR